MFHVRPAYSPDLASRSDRRYSNAQVGAGRSSIVKVGADATPANTPVPTDTTVDLKDVGLYVAIPAVLAGGAAALLGLGTMWTLGAGVLGGGAGFFYLDYAEKDRKAAAEKNAKDAADALEAKRRASLDITAVAAQSDPIGVQAKAGLSLFSIGMVPGGSTVDYKLAAFPAKPTDAVVKQLTDLQKALSAAGYALAASEMAEAASAAALLRDVVDGTPTASTTTPTSGGTAEAAAPGSLGMFGT